MLNKKCLILAAGLAIPFISSANGLSYDFLEGGYQKSTQRYGNADDVDADGYQAGGSVSLNPHVYINGGYDHATTDKVFGGYAEYDTFRLGAGYRHPLTSKLDFNAGGGAIFAKVDPKGTASSAFSSDEDTGYYINTGLRAEVLPQLEVNGGFEYSKVFDESETTARVGTVFSLTKNFGLVGDYAFGDNTNTYRLGGRFNFR